MANAWNTAGAETLYSEPGTSLASTHIRAVYSKEILFKAMPLLRFLQFAKYQEELGVQPGLTIQIMTYRDIAGGGALTEGVAMETKALSAFYKTITVTEQGNAWGCSELALRASFTDVMADATTALSRNMAVVLDCQFRDAALTGRTIDGVSTPVIYGRADKNAAIIDARNSITSTNIVSVATVKDAVELLATNNVPKFEGDYYIGIIHPHVSRNLRDDPAFLEVSKYANPDSILRGEVGRIEDVRFIETSLMRNGACATTDRAYLAALDKTATAALGVDAVYQSIIFGEEYYGYAVALPVELRDNGVEDFGRKHSLAWYAIWGVDVLNAERGVIIESA